MFAASTCVLLQLEKQKNKILREISLTEYFSPGKVGINDNLMRVMSGLASFTDFWCFSLYNNVIMLCVSEFFTIFPLK